LVRKFKKAMFAMNFLKGGKKWGVPLRRTLLSFDRLRGSGFAGGTSRETGKFKPKLSAVNSCGHKRRERMVIIPERIAESRAAGRGQF